MIGARGAGRVPARHVFFRPQAQDRSQSRIARRLARRRKPIAATGATRSPGVKLERLGFREQGEKKRSGKIPRRPPIFLSFFLLFCCVVVLLFFFAHSPFRLSRCCAFCSPTGLGKTRRGRQFCFGRPARAPDSRKFHTASLHFPPFLANVAVFRGRGRALRSVCQARRAPPGLSGFSAFRPVVVVFAQWRRKPF